MPSYLSSTHTSGPSRRTISAASSAGEASMNLSGWKRVISAKARVSSRASVAGEVAGQPSVVVLPVPRPRGAKRVTINAIESSLPDATGAFVEWLIRDSGWTVTERDRPGERVKIEARHVCLLFRRFDHFFKQDGDATHDYVQALEARGIPHLLVGGGSFHNREEVGTVRAALSAIEWPDDELSVFATLHGSFFALCDEELFEYRHRYKRLHPFRLPDDAPAHLKPVVCLTYSSNPLSFREL